MTPASQVQVHVDGESSGVAYVKSSSGGAELCVLGKLSLVLLGGGQAAIVARPEPPGVHRGVPAPAELDDAVQGMLVIAGPRSCAGRVVLRRGTAIMADVALSGGSETVTVPSSALHSAAGGDDEWLVVEGVDAPDARRWCKLPKMHIVASWEPAAQLILGARACLIDLGTWTVSFILRGTPIPVEERPSHVTLSVEDTYVSSVRPIPPGLGESIEAETQTGRGDVDDDDGVRTAVRAAAQQPARPLEEAPSTEQATRLIPIAPLPPEALRDGPSSAPRTTQRRGAAAARSSRAGLRLGGGSGPGAKASSKPPEPEPDPPRIEDETTAVGRIAVDSDGPSSVTRAFASLSPETFVVAERTEVRSELVRRIQRGEPLAGLDLRGARLAGVSLAGASLSGLDLSGVDLRGADLAGTDLRSARLDGAQLDGSRLDGANLDGASLVGASLRSITLSGATFAGADFTDAQIGGSHTDAAFAGADLTRARRV